MTTCANRGKSTEKKVENFLKSLNCKANVAYLRFPDSRSARNFLAAQPADFLVICNGVPVFIESKHLNASYRLTKNKVSQHAALAKFNAAGAKALVVVEHEGVGWRAVNIEDLEFGVPSWDLRAFPLYNSAEEALKSSGYFNLGEE